MLNLKDFEFIRIIGSGAFGKVFLAKYKNTSKFFAVKQMDIHALKQNRQLDSIVNESSILEEVRACPFIVKFLNTIHTKDHVLIVMEFVTGGELFYYLKKYGRFPIKPTRFFTCEIIIALKYMHDRGILYRDLKPENILLTDKGHIKLADFGFATKINDNIYTLCGTPEYMAPEKLNGDGDSSVTDYWSLGCLIYEMLVGQPPFYAEVPQLIYKRVIHEEVKFPSDICEDAKDLIARLLAKNRCQRLGFNGISEIMNHKFFRNICWEDVENLVYCAPFAPDLNQFEGLPGENIQSERPIYKPTTGSYKRVFKVREVGNNYLSK